MTSNSKKTSTATTIKVSFEKQIRKKYSQSYQNLKVPFSKFKSKVFSIRCEATKENDDKVPFSKFKTTETGK